MTKLARRLRTGTLVLLLAAVGCGKKAAPKADPPPAEVVVVRPVVDAKFVETEEFTGYTRAEKTVDIRARVTGYLLNEKESGFKFEEGADVEEGQSLFKIDSRTYQAEADKAEASVRQAEATYERLSGDLRRARAAGRSVSTEEVERIAGNRLEAEAAVKAARATLESARLNVGFTTVKSPIAGRLSRQHIDPGNLVKADDTVLTTVVSLDPIHAYFDIDERTVLDVRKRIRDKEVVSAREAKVYVDVGLANEAGFTRKGEIDFVDNQLDPGTGTLRVRAKVANPAPRSISMGKAGKTHMLSPGMFVRIRLPVGKERTELLVPEDALGSDQGERFVYVVDKDKDGKDVARQHKVVVGQQVVTRDPDGKETSMRAVQDAKPSAALAAKDRPRPYKLSRESLVVVAGQQRVRSGKPVKALLRDEPKVARAVDAK